MDDNQGVPSLPEGTCKAEVPGTLLRLLFLGICLISGKLWAISPEEKLEDLSVTHWGAKYGIPEETFAALLAPGDGYVWLASNHGLVRFDGKSASVFRLGDTFRPNGTGSCSSSTLSNLELGSDGNIWAGSASGCIFHLKRDRFGTFASFRLFAMEAPDSGRELNGVTGLRNASDGKRMEVTRRSGFGDFEIDVPAWQTSSGGPPSRAVAGRSAERRLLSVPDGARILLSSTDPNGHRWAILSDNELYSASAANAAWGRPVEWRGASKATPLRLLAGRNGTVWVASDAGLHRVQDRNTRQWGPAQGLPKVPVWALHEDRAGCLWMGFSQAVARLCGDNLESIPLGTDEEEVVSAIAEDPQGNIWLGGRWGNLYRISSSIIQSFTRREGLPESHLTGVTVDTNGDVWGSTRESGLVRLSGGRVVQTVRLPEVLEAQTLVADPNGGIVAASARGIVHADSKSAELLRFTGPLSFRNLPALGFAPDGSLLFSNANFNYRLRRSRSPGMWNVESLAGPARIRQWTAAATGEIWALAQYEGLHRLDGVVYRPAPNSEPGRARAWYGISAGQDGLLWIGTTDGLEIYDTRQGRYLTNQPLLFGDQIFHITADRFGKIWCATRRGIVRFARTHALEVAASRNRGGSREFFVERFNEEQSLPTTNFGLVTSATGATAKDGRIWFPGLLGLISLQPADFERKPRAPAALLHRVKSDEKELDLNQPLRVPPGGKTLEFEFQSIRLDPLGGNFCRSMLQGFDPAWQTCSESRAAQYTNLPPGSYEFAVQTASQAGVWDGNELRVPLEILPAFHELVWVRALAALSILAGIGFLFWRRQEQLLERNRWLEKKVRERTANLAKAVDAAEAANRAKSQFLATMSHEIRTPMNGVLGAVQMLDSSALNQEQKKLVSVIQQSGGDLVAIVDDILSLAKVEAGKLTLESAPVNVPLLCENLVALFRPKAESKGVSIRFVPGSGIPEQVLSDPQRLRQILLNLIGNAVKFTSQGEVRLRVTRGPAESTLCFHVEDTGMGIPAGKLDTLFDPFVQVDSSTTRRFGGSGLGLSIVRRFVDAMGGSIAVESKPECGSAFIVTIPFQEAPDIPESTGSPLDEAADPLPQCSGLTVLLAEDNRVNQLVFQKMLLRLGCHVVVASEGREALGKLRQGGIDLVLMDCQMPELDGYQTTRELRAWGGEYERIPVIALTASALEEDRQNCFDAGMNDFLSKPLLLSTLAATLAHWCPAGSKNSSAPEPAAGPANR